MLESLLDERPRGRAPIPGVSGRSTAVRWFVPFIVVGIIWSIPKMFYSTLAWFQGESIAISRLESDMTAVKKIVAGIVPAVKQLADGRVELASSINNEEEKLAVVTSARANIRREPALDSPSIMTINQGSVLLIRTNEGEWIQVLTPLGEPGWMHRSVLRVE
jgi:hypothetical protein